jgi:hypothetical protein
MSTPTITEIAEQVKAMMPTVNFNKNGYEIRAQVLEMAQSQIWNDYHSKWGAFECSISHENNDLVTKVTMPTVPGTEQVLEAAEKFYAFVTNGVVSTAKPTTKK